MISRSPATRILVKSTLYPWGKPVLQGFVTEQVEEEDIIRDIVKDLKRIGDSNDGLFMLDRELKQRQIQSNAAKPE